MVVVSPSLELNVVPITFSKNKLTIGSMLYEGKEEYRELREQYWRTHSFRYDEQTERIQNIPIVTGTSALGETQELDLSNNLLLMARGVQQAILVWIAEKGIPILQGIKPLTFWGQTTQALLLTQVVQKHGEAVRPGLEVAIKYEIDCRVFRTPEDDPYLGLVIDVSTSNLVEIPASELLAARFSLHGKYVCRRKDFPHQYLKPKLEIIGRVQAIRGTKLILTDTDIANEVNADEVLLEPRNENLEAVIKHLYKAKGSLIVNDLRIARKSLMTAQGKRDLIHKTAATLNKEQFVIAGDITVGVGSSLTPKHKCFPETILTDRPNLLFGPQGRSSGLYPDPGLTTHGPFMYMLHERNAPLIAVICEKSERGLVEQFAESLRYGFDDKLWADTNKKNPFPNGLIGKFRLSRVEFEYEECKDASASSYNAAVKRLLERTSRTPDLALIQIRERFKQLPAHTNPYYVSKAAFMMAGVPTQDVLIENMRKQGEGLAYLLNNVSLAMYAKLDGTPWVIATHRPSTYELVVGLGSTEVASTRLGTRKRYVGITTMFQGDGMYLVWGLTREVEFEEYAPALLESLRTTIRYVQAQNGWQVGDKIRLVCHVYKRLRDCEVEAIKKIVRELIDSRFVVEFAFLDISEQHLYHIFDNSQQGVPYWVNKRKFFKGKGLPERGLCLQLDDRRGLLHLTGPKEVKTDAQGLPKPLLVELHRDSDFTDMTYLLRQIYHFTFMSWRSFFPATQPVTIKYSQLIANLLGHLNLVKDWNSTVLSVGSLRGRRWFL